LEDHVLALVGCCTFKLLHALENDQVLLAHPKWGQGSLTIFFKGVKIGLNLSVLAARTWSQGE